MNIVKSFSDYYDGAWIADEDPKHIWVRERREHNIPIYTSAHTIDNSTEKLLKAFNIWSQEKLADVYGYANSSKLQLLNRLLAAEVSTKESKVSIRFKVLLVNGIVYPYAQLFTAYAPDRFGHEKLTRDTSFDLSTINSWIESLDYKFNIFSSNVKSKKDAIDRVNELFREIKADWKADAIHKHFDSPIIDVGFYRRRKSKEIINNSSISFDVNINLKELGFQKVMDPFTLKQELEYYYCNVLAPNEVMVEIGNDSKIKAHGFDLKDSFRKRSGTKRSRKQ